MKDPINALMYQLMKESLIEQFLHSEDDIDTVWDKFNLAYIDVDEELVGQVWGEVIDEFPELN